MTHTSRQSPWRCLRAVVALTAIVACQAEEPPASAQLAALATTPAPATTSAPQQPKPEDFSVVGVAPGDVLHLRLLPDASSKSRIWIPPGATNVSDEGGTVPGEDEQTTWRHVGYAGFVGWVNARFLKSNRAPTNSSSAPVLATGSQLGALSRVVCFGKRPAWSLALGTDGSARCEGSCGGAAGLRAANVSVSYHGDLQGFALIGAQDQVVLQATTRATAQCRVGGSQTEHYYEFRATGARGPLKGCCRIPRAVPALGHLRSRQPKR